jgi:glutathione-regulated potassium-efflux system ancillary protein KefC
MSTGLTFGSISALFGLTHGIIDQGNTRCCSPSSSAARWSPRSANAYSVPKYLLPKPVPSGKTAPAAAGMAVKAER